MRSATRSANTSGMPRLIGMPATSRASQGLSTSPTRPGVTLIVWPEMWR